jgi:ABC-2 type transport system permease protein
VVYEISGFRRSLCGIAAAIFLAICLAVVWWIFKTGYRLKQSSAASGLAGYRSALR